MPYQKSYVELQLNFAQVVAEKLKISLIEALYSYTNLFLSLTLDFSFNQQNEMWKDFTTHFENSADYIYGKYLKSQDSPEHKDVRKSEPFGCFSYHIENDGVTLKIHFSNNEFSNLGPLAKENFNKRQSELKNMFNYVKTAHPNIKYVKGKSWLYSLDAYKRIFPEKFIESLTEFDGAEWQFMTRWGQFLDSGGNIKVDLANQFLKCIKTKVTTNEMLDCFPLKVYTALCNVEYFYRFTEDTL